jgi:hypothetical protein
MLRDKTVLPKGDNAGNSVGQLIFAVPIPDVGRI